MSAITPSARVRDALSSGEWLTRRQVEAVTGLSCGVVNDHLQSGIYHGPVEKETPMVKRTKGITQRYRQRKAS